MLSLPDFREKKILVVPIKEKLENQLKLENSNIVLSRNSEVVNKVSCHIIFCVFIVGDCTLTSRLIRQLKDYGISVFLLNRSFQIYAEILSAAEGNYKLREAQYTVKSKFELGVAKNIVRNKVLNQYKTLKKLKKNPDKEMYLLTKKQIEKTTKPESLLGLEGKYSSYYFSNVFKDIGWYRRAPRTKEDVSNLMLDIGYTFLFNYADALLRLFGFDTYKGVYHKLFFQRKSLACDLIEPMRPIVDYQLVKSHNLKQITEKDFEYTNGAFKFKDYKTSQRYTRIWFDLIMDNREEIYQYILDHYRFFQHPQKYKSPKFTIPR